MGCEQVSRIKQRAIAANVITADRWNGCLAEGMEGPFGGAGRADF